MKKFLFVSFITSFLILPIAVLAVNYQTWVSDIMTRVALSVWQFFFGITVIMFIVAGILFVTSSGDPGRIKTARSAVIWGVVGIIIATISFVIVGVVSGWVN